MSFTCYRCNEWPCVCKDGITLIHADCQDVWRELPSDDVLIIADPPYGISAHDMRASLPKSPGSAVALAGDDSEELAAWVLGVIGETPAVVFGANNWPHLLPHKGRWLCWDKRCDERADKMLGSAFELAWENRHSGYDMMVRKQHGGVVNADHKRFGRGHPTQKPVALFAAILERYPNEAIVVDPFGGSCAVAVACKDIGRRCYTVEIEERYIELAANRLRQEVLF